MTDFDVHSVWNQPAVVIPVFVVGTVAVTVVAVVLGALYYEYRKNELEAHRRIEKDKLDAGLKQEMLERGFTADDIVKVLNAPEPPKPRGFFQSLMDNVGHKRRCS